jgi:4,5-dihydroxyphthalate decarboxylase
MSDISLSLAISYYDHVSDLLNERVRPEGIKLTAMELPVEEIFFRMLSFVEWDVAEFSLAKYVGLVATGTAPFRAIPVFPSRVFRQSSFYVAKQRTIRRPEDLVGRRIGVPEWAQTAGVYARAYLQHQCAISLRDIQWVQGGVNEPGRTEKVKLSLPTGVEVQQSSDRSLNEMLISGDLDCIISAREPSSSFGNDPEIVRLWPDYKKVEEGYYQSTGIFPIMHAIVIKNETLARHPWISMNLLKAFEVSKTNSINRLSSLVNSRVAIPWSHVAVQQARQVFGDDFWPYGIEPNKKTLSAFLQYCHEQGVTGRGVQISELFPAETAKFVKV